MIFLYPWHIIPRVLQCPVMVFAPVRELYRHHMAAEEKHHISHYQELKKYES